MAEKRFARVDLSLFEVAKAAMEFSEALRSFEPPEWFAKLGPPGLFEDAGGFGTIKARREWVKANKFIWEEPFSPSCVCHILAQYLLMISVPGEFAQLCKDHNEGLLEYRPADAEAMLHETAASYLRWNFNQIYGSFAPLGPESAWTEGYDDDGSWDMQEWYRIQGLDENGREIEKENFLRRRKEDIEKMIAEDNAAAEKAENLAAAEKENS